MLKKNSYFSCELSETEFFVGPCISPETFQNDPQKNYESRLPLKRPPPHRPSYFFGERNEQVYDHFVRPQNVCPVTGEKRVVHFQNSCPVFCKQRESTVIIFLFLLFETVYKKIKTATLLLLCTFNRHLAAKNIGFKSDAGLLVTMFPAIHCKQ